MKNKNISKFVTSLVYVVLGAALIIEPTLMENMFSCLLAGAAIVIGLLKLVSYLFTKVETRIEEDTNGFALGISLMILGVFVLADGAMFIMLIPFVLGFMITFKGIEGIQNILNLRKFGFPIPKVTLILSLVIAAFGILVMINPFSTKKLLLVLLGIGLAISGVFDIAADIIFTQKMKKGPQDPKSAPAKISSADAVPSPDTAPSADDFVEFKSDLQ